MWSTEKGHTLYLGGVEAAADAAGLFAAGVSHVIDLSRRSYPKRHDLIYYMEIDLPDHPEADIRCHFEPCVEFIAQALESGSVLVHCKHGRSRSSSAVMAFLMKSLGMDLGEAVRLCVAKRPVVKPNSGFLGQLRDYERELKLTTSYQDLRARRLGRGYLGRSIETSSTIDGTRTSQTVS